MTVIMKMSEVSGEFNENFSNLKDIVRLLLNPQAVESDRTGRKTVSMSLIFHWLLIISGVFITFAIKP